ncbi:MAG: CHASE2 domain-containing protein [Chloroflexi bacterium]|nr:CHASE2 domain-containing protein [Chloroflexota bacterium]
MTPLALRTTRRQEARRSLWIGALVAALLLLLWATNAFAQLRLRLSNVYFVPTPVSQTIVIVALDDAALQTYGRSPREWSRAVYADLVARLSAAQARVIAFDLLFDIATEDDAVFAQAIDAARQSDARTRTILAAAGVQNQTRSGTLLPALAFTSQLLPAPTLRSAAENVGYVNTFPDIDGAIRRQSSLLYIDQNPAVAFPLAVYFAYLRFPTSEIANFIASQTPQPGTLIAAPERTLAVDGSGLWLQNYFGLPSSDTQQTFPVVSLRDVLAGSVDAQLFNDKVVLVGAMHDTTAADEYPVPAAADGRMMAGVEIHANAIETLLQNRFVYEQTPLSSVVMIVTLSLLASLIYSQLRWYWMLPTAVLLLLIWVIFAFLLFGATGQMLNLFHSGLALAGPLLFISGVNLSAEISRRRKTEFLLESVVQVTTQRLELERVLARLAEDIRRLSQAPLGVIWLWGENDSTAELGHFWGQSAPECDRLRPLAEQARASRVLTTQQPYIAVPILWQQRALAVFVIHPSARDTAPALLEELARQIAPGLENTLLHRDVQQQKTLLEGVLAASPAGILLLDSELRILQQNTAARANLSPYGDTLLQKLPENARTALSEAVQRGEAFRDEITLGTKTFYLDAAPLPGVQRWVVALNDVSTLAELNRIKTHMIRMGSHDLKNPLSRIIGYGSLIQKLQKDMPTLPEKQHDYLKSMIQAAEQMRGIINDLLDLEQLRAGDFTREVIEFATIVREAASQQQPEIQAKGQRLNTAIVDSAQVIGNFRQLSALVTNLLGNASKYTPAGGTITVRLHASDETHIRLEVEDTGYGIPAEAQSKLFSEFYRVRTESTANIPGTGLGLSLVKTAAEAHGGRVWVHSQEGVGSTFFVELPLRKALTKA